MQPPPKRDKRQKAAPVSIEDEKFLAQLTVKPMLELKEKPDTFLPSDFEWDSDNDLENCDDTSESRTLLSNSTENVER
jgi:hypothetical protein